MAAPIDPDLVLPPAIRRAAAEAERLAAEANGAQEPAAPAEAAPAPVPAPEAVAPVEPPATPVVETPAAPAPEPARDAAYWEQRCRTIQGKYDVEVPSLTARLRASEAQITSMHGEIADLNMRLSRQPTAAPTAPDVAPEDVEQYGQEFIDRVRAWTRGNAPAPSEAKLTQLEQEVARLRQQTVTSNVDAAKTAVQAALNARVPQWAAMNTDPAFLAWLAQPDAFSGRMRQEMIEEAYTRGDAPRTIAFFEAYIAEQTAVGSTGTPPAHTPNGAGTVPLEDLAAPGRGRPASPGAPAEKRLWTQPQIAAFYNDVARGRYRTNEAEKLRLEADIHAAVAEGRIRP